MKSLTYLLALGAFFGIVLFAYGQYGLPIDEPCEPPPPDGYGAPFVPFAPLLGFVTGYGGGGGGGEPCPLPTCPPDCPLPVASLVDLFGPSLVELPSPIPLSWDSSNTTPPCTASGDWSGSKPTSGSESVPKSRGTYSFTLTCFGLGGSASDSITVRVVQFPSCTFGASPGVIVPPQSSRLSWSCSFADTCSINQGIGSVNNVSGTNDVRPPRTTIYTLNCSNVDGSRSWDARVTVGFIPFLREILPFF